MHADPIGYEILSAKPRVRNDLLDIAAAAPPNSFGQAYARFMETHGFEPDGRSTVQYIDDPELAYIMQRFRELHDFWHVLFDLPPTELGELALKYVELMHTALPVCALSTVVGPLRLKSAERRVFRDQYIPWARRMGTTMTSNLMCVYYEKELNVSLDELRTRLNIELAPQYEA